MPVHTTLIVHASKFIPTRICSPRAIFEWLLSLLSNYCCEESKKKHIVPGLSIEVTISTDDLLILTVFPLMVVPVDVKRISSFLNTLRSVCQSYGRR